LNYARDRDELGTMCNAIASCLRPGGRFVSINSSPALDYSTAPSYRKYGFEINVLGEFREGVPITWAFFLEDEAFEIENYFLDVSVHEEMFRSVGFRAVHWHRPRLSQEGESKFLEMLPGSFAHYRYRMFQIKSAQITIRKIGDISNFKRKA